MAKWLDLLHESEDLILEDIAILGEIKYVLRKVGSEELADDLSIVITHLHSANKNIRTAMGLKTTEDVKSAEGMSSAIFEAVLNKSLKKENKKNVITHQK